MPICIHYVCITRIIHSLCARFYKQNITEYLIFVVLKCGSKFEGLRCQYGPGQMYGNFYLPSVSIQAKSMMMRQCDQLSSSKTRPKCTPNLFYVKINSLTFPWKKVSQKVGLLLQFSKDRPK
jgi:hypothetical protein